MAPKLKRQKVAADSRRTASSSSIKYVPAAALSRPMVPNVVQNMGVDPRIQRAKNFAVAQAQQEGCMGNFRIIDSPFGNYLVPVIPTRAELGG